MVKAWAENLAVRFFEGTKYQPSEREVKKLSCNILLLEQAGLSKLNKRLVQGGRKVWDTLVEHNIAVELILLHGSSASIAYEPTDFSTPPDFKKENNNLTYWVQVKNLSRLERENRQIKNLEQIRRYARALKVSKFFQVLLFPEFQENEMQGLQQFIAETAKESVDNEEYPYPDARNLKAKITFWSPQEVKLSHLTLGISGDMEMAELTGMAKEQIKGSLLKGASAFKWKADQTTLNLIVLDADEQHDLNICEALYGTEFEIVSKNRHAWSREKDGLFHNQDFSAKITGIFGIRRKEPLAPLSEFDKILYVNETFQSHIESMMKLLSVAKVVHFNMRPEGRANF